MSLETDTSVIGNRTCGTSHGSWWWWAPAGQRQQLTAQTQLMIVQGLYLDPPMVTMTSR